MSHRTTIRTTVMLTAGFVLCVAGVSTEAQEIRFRAIRQAPLGSPAGTIGGPVQSQFNAGLGCWEVFVPPGVEVDLALEATGWEQAVGAPTLGAIQATVIPGGYQGSISASPNSAIPDCPADHASNPPVGSNIVVTSGGTVNNLRVAVRIDHTWVGDLLLLLTHFDTATNVILMSRIGLVETGWSCIDNTGFGCGADNIDCIFDDFAALDIENACPPIGGVSYRPSADLFGPQSLSVFNGQPANGTWNLTVYDGAEFDTGTLVEWSLIGVGAVALTPKGWPAVPSDGSYQPTKSCTANGDPCSGPFDGSCGGGAGGFCVDNSNFVMPICANALNARATPTLDYAWASAAQVDCNQSSGGDFKVLGGLILNVPSDAAGTYVVRLDPSEFDTFMTSGAGKPIPGVILTPACITVGLAPPRLPAAPHDTLKNRYISFDPNNGATLVAFFVTLSDGRQCIVGEPCLRSDTNGVDPQWVAECGSSGSFRDWSSYTDPATGNPVVHVRGCAILPDETYDVEALSLSGPFSIPLTLDTVPHPSVGSWADIVGDFIGGSWTAPNGINNFKDVNASIQSFQQLPTAPAVSWVDLVDLGGTEQPNYTINFNDVSAIIRGFLDVPYPGTVSGCVIPATATACP